MNYRHHLQRPEFPVDLLRNLQWFTEHHHHGVTLLGQQTPEECLALVGPVNGVRFIGHDI